MSKRKSPLTPEERESMIRTSIRIEETAKDALQALAAENGRSLTTEIEEAIRIYLEAAVSEEPGRFQEPTGAVPESTKFLMAPFYPQRVSAGPGQELMLAEPSVAYGTDRVPRVPYPLKWGKDLISVECKGDSMTGVHLFSGDLVFYRPGEIDEDGIYVLQVNGTIMVKRVEFNRFDKKLTISSENARYPSRVEAADSQAVTILGKVRGWMHQHTY